MITTKIKKISSKSIGIILIILVAVGFILKFTVFKKSKIVSKLPVIEQTQPLSLEEMPLVLLSPKEEGHQLLLQIKEAKDTDSLEYELIYELEEGLTRGASGEIELIQGKGEKNILLGTCSSGTCKYDKGIVGGNLTISLKKGNKLRSFKTTFSFWDGSKIQQSSDGKLTIKLIGNRAAKYILLKGGGLPKPINREIIGGPYNLASELGNEKSEITLNSEGQLFFWDEKEWVTVENLESASLGTYIVVK
ncbi:hypothetical protein COT63_01310 [Candidatus Shapirobacteria bacterium CG09_land_8_20_14_0_10_38_17]|uniref:Uncharacterized protein n=1 Tax=Candidatus Shapirobacteria bacterium CG09_land_8_20_14_0_10_38_17 TaxID=1974884 RepID=A0A2H0WTE4_9BACT|nr:MAG: hypothetical protein COT63_01310 [Candidatus Shapirobacteria bacterium CG09_land_8_20_14_0_10_38_17]